MKSAFYITLLLFLSTINHLVGQNTSEYWDNYLATYEDEKPGSITLRMDLIEEAPISNLSFVLVTGITYNSVRDDGFPESEIFPILHKIADELIALISEETEYLLVGSFTYNKERLEYFYVNNVDNLKEKIEKYYSENYPEYKYYLNIKEDKEWEYYKSFLYPNEETLNYMMDQSVIRNLQEAGDDLSKKRRVNHWLYFSNENDMNNCLKELKIQNFSIESANRNAETALAYQLQVYRMDHVDINSIYPVTSSLRKIALKYDGRYDGWETSVEKN